MQIDSFRSPFKNRSQLKVKVSTFHFGYLSSSSRVILIVPNSSLTCENRNFKPNQPLMSSSKKGLYSNIYLFPMSKYPTNGQKHKVPFDSKTRFKLKFAVNLIIILCRNWKFLFTPFCVMLLFIEVWYLNASVTI